VIVAIACRDLAIRSNEREASAIVPPYEITALKRIRYVGTGPSSS